MRITAEDLLRMPIDEKLWELSKNREITVVFCDGEVTASGGMTIIARYIWILLERYAAIPILKRYHPECLGILTTMTHAEIAARIVLEDARDYYLGSGLPWDEQDEDFYVYKMTNVISNMIDLHLQRFVVSVDAIDFAEIEKHPEIVTINTRIRSMDIEHITPDDIAKAHQDIKEVILENPDLDKNPVAILARQKLVKIPQLLISVGPIGFLTEVNDVMFKYPVLSNYVSGFTRLYEPALESRNATIASLYQEILMRESEYLSRKLSLIGEFVYNLHRGVDCGSKRYVKVHVKSAKKLAAMSGIWMKVNEQHDLQPIRSDMKHLIGKTVEVRAPNKCDHPDRSGICEVCFSELSIQIPDLHLSREDMEASGRTLQISTSIGHTCVVCVTSEASQNVLSTKHNKELKSAQKIILTTEEEQLLTLSEDGRELYFRKGTKMEDLILVLREKDTQDIHEADSEGLEKLSASKMTSIQEFTIFNRKTNERLNFFIGEEERAGFLSKDMLKHLGTEGYEVHQRLSSVLINLDGYNTRNPFIIIPQISYSPVQEITDMENFILSIKGKKGKPGLNGFETVDEALDGFYTLLEDSEAHLIHLMMVLLCVSAQDPENGDYRIPIPRDSGKPMSDGKLLYMRSVGSGLAYESHASLFSDAVSYVEGRRQPHHYDWHMMQVLPEGLGP